MKKGVTILELAMVLVLIGIIMAASVKGKNLIENAKEKKGISAVIGVKNSFLVYVALNGENEKWRKRTSIFFNEFPEVLNYYLKGYPSCRQRYSSVIWCDGENYGFSLWNYHIVGEHFFLIDYDYNNQTTAFPGVKNIVSFSLYNGDIADSPQYSDYVDKQHRFSCVVDYVLDDGIPYSGDIRYTSDKKGNVHKVKSMEPRSVQECRALKVPLDELKLYFYDYALYYF